MDIAVRDVTMDQLEQVAPLWDQAWRVSGRRRTAVPLALSIDRMRRRVDLAAGGGYRFPGAWIADEPVGIATVSLTDGGPHDGRPWGVHPRPARRRGAPQPPRRHRVAHRSHRDGPVRWDRIGWWSTCSGLSRDVARWYAGWGFGPI